MCTISVQSSLRDSCSSFDYHLLACVALINRTSCRVLILNYLFSPRFVIFLQETFQQRPGIPIANQAVMQLMQPPPRILELYAYATTSSSMITKFLLLKYQKVMFLEMPRSPRTNASLRSKKL